MDDGSSPRAAIRPLPIGAGVVVVAIGVVVLVGWGLHREPLMRVLPGWVPMKANAAVCLVLAGASLLLRALGGARPAARAVAVALAVLVAVVGALSLAEWIVDVDLGLDEVLVRDLTWTTPREPGRMAATTALALVFTAWALGVADQGDARRRPAEPLLVVPVVLATLTVIGWAYRANLLYGLALHTTMSLPSAVAFVLLAVGIVGLHPDRGWTGLALGPTPGGYMIRHLLPGAMLAPLGVGVLALAVHAEAVTGDARFDDGLLVGIVALGSLLVVTALIGRNARALDALDAARSTARAEVTELEAERRVRETFVAALSHDLRGPLTAARLSADLLGSGRVAPEAVPATTAKLRRSLDRADGMIRDLLDVSRVRSGGTLPLTREEVELVALLHEVLDGLAELHGDRFRLVADGPVVGTWSRDALRRVVENLCANAVKYGAPGGIVTLTVGASPTEATLAVHNVGAPIAAEDLPHLFEPFRRTRGAEAGRAGGWGVGLALVRAVAEAHGGRVDVTSTPEDGTCFTVRLPRGA
jgi:signal transduction histidine kinase